MAAAILLVEDDAIIAEDLAANLRRLGYQVIGPYAAGEDAVAAAGAQRPDLVLMDIALAGRMDGITAADQLRARHNVPVVFLTAHADPITLARAKIAEPFGYLVKPFPAASLQATLEVALYKHALNQQLKESEARYHIVADHAADWEYWEAPDGRLLYCSPSCARLTGRPAEYFLAAPHRLVEIVLPEDQARFAEHRSIAEAAGDEQRLEFRVTLPDGAPRWLEHVCRPVHDAAGVYRGRRASNRDITDRKQAETALRQQTDSLQGVAEAANLLLANAVTPAILTTALERLGRAWSADRAYIFQDRQDPATGAWLTSQLCEWTRAGVSAQLDNPDLQNLPYAPDFARWPAILTAGRLIHGPVAGLPAAERVFLEAQGIQSIIVAPIFVGERYWGHVGLDACHQPRVWSPAEAVSLRIAADSLGSALKRQAAEAGLHASETRYRQIFEANQAIKLVVDPVDGRIVEANAAAGQFYGYDLAVLTTLRIQDLNTLSEAEVLADMAQAVAAQRLYFTFQHRLASGAVRDVDVYSGPVQVGDRTLLYSIVYDVTERRQAAAALEREKQRYQYLLQTSADAIHILDQAGNLREWNAAFLAHLGCRPEEAAGLNVADWDLNGSAEQLRAKIVELIQTPARFETRHRRRDGAVRAVEINAIGVTLDGEDLLYASARDITERKRLETELQTERDFALSVMNTMGQGLTVTDAALRFEYINPAYAAFMGYRPEELLGKSPVDVTVDLDQAELARARAARLAGQTTTYESRLRRADGGVVDVLITGTPRWREGRVQGAIAVITDLTERKQAERAMAEERTRLRALISASRDGIALIGTDRQVYVVNEPALQYLNLPGRPADWEGRPLAEALRVMQAQAAPAALFADARRVEQGAEQPAEGEWALPTRTLHWISQPVRAGDRWLGWLVVLRDVTAERQVEHLRDDLTRTMVHDLRNPLNSVSSALHLLTNAGDERLSASQQTVVDLALQGTESMLDLVTAILDVSRLESGQMPLQREPISLRQLTTQLVHQQTPVAQARRQTLTADFAPDLPAVYADAGLLRRVLQNLVGNALKFTPAGGRVELAAAVPAGANQMWLSVSDTGPGIAAEVRDRLFQKFVTGRVPGHGSGLGLAFCRQVVEAHGGRIWVEPASAAGGATFTFTMPIWEPPAEER